MCFPVDGVGMPPTSEPTMAPTPDQGSIIALWP
jgi:hypothetical protein